MAGFSLQVTLTGATFTASNTSPAACSLPGTRVGDVVTNVFSSGSNENIAGFFESTISVADEIQLLSGNDNVGTEFGTLVVTLNRVVAVP